MELVNRVTLVLFSLLLLFQAAVSSVLEGCPSSYTWLVYNGAERILRCDSSSQDHWWQRNTTQGSAECELKEDEWVQADQTCRDSRTCSVRVTSATTTLEYCCTSGDNPATTADGRYFNLAICPKVTSLTVPSKIIAGTPATIYLTVAVYPTSSFNHPTLRHRSPGQTSTTITPQISTHTDFIHLTVAYSFTVPSQGKVELGLVDILPPEGSACQSASGDFEERYEMIIVQADAVGPSTSQPSSKPPSQTPITSLPSGSVTPTYITQPSPSPGTPSSSSSSSPPSPSSSPPSPTSSPPTPSSSLPSPSSSPSQDPPSSKSNGNCPSSTDDDVPLLICVAIVSVVLSVVVTSLVVCGVCWRRRRSTGGSETSSLLQLAKSPVNDETKVSIGPPVSPLPLPLPLPPRPLSHQIFVDCPEESVESGIIVTAPPPLDPKQPQTDIYSTVGTPSPHHTSHRNSSQSTHVRDSGDMTYAFVCGKLFKREGDDLDLDPKRNGDSVSI